ncbi:MAG: metalloregulator ArsR/SmtB family transcription factor [Candidatus Bathyarchaeia archaeon]
MNREKILLDYRVRILNALSDPLRLEIVELLKDGERCVCDIIPFFGRSQSTISKHLDVLYQVGILDRRVEGKRTIYNIKDTQILNILRELDIFVLNQISSLTKAIKLPETQQSDKR